MSDDHRLYSALPALISGQCGKETGREHASIIQTTLNGIAKSNLRTISIASDGESRRGEALIYLTFKKQLELSSPIYPILSILPLMNLEVGDDDVTADKDYKHIFKRCRNLLLRDRGTKVHGVDILPSMLQSQLRKNEVPISQINNLLKPDDKQDVKLAYDLLSQIWSLPSLDLDTSVGPGFTETREALCTLGKVFMNTLLPYVCVELSLSEQLTLLSTVAHMLLAMAHEDKAGTKLMPSQLYIDLMIMIKNAYFCVAKTKVDDPIGKFFLILLGTDRLEDIFGILRTMVGNDSTLDLLQLILRLGGTTEVSAILANHPEWDRSPRRLKLPAVSKDGMAIHKDIDHIKPSAWKGNVYVSEVNLQTCWMRGRQKVKEVPRLDEVLKKIEAANNPSINILQPFGLDIVRAARAADDYDDTAEDYDTGSGQATDTDPQLPHIIDTELEDAAMEEEEIKKHDPCFELDGTKVWKSRYLSECFKDLRNPGSRDRLKLYANVSRYAIKQDSRRDIIDSDSSEGLQGPTINMDFPVATLLKCEGRLFVCIGETNDITFDSKHVDSLPVDLLSEPSAYVSFQMLYLVPATIEDSVDLKHDWKWSFSRGTTHRVQGCLIEPINPDISTQHVGKPFYLFESTVLRSLGTLLLGRITREEANNIPQVKRSTFFPYREVSGMQNFSQIDIFVNH